MKTDNTTLVMYPQEQAVLSFLIQNSDVLTRDFKKLTSLRRGDAVLVFKHHEVIHKLNPGMLMATYVFVVTRSALGWIKLSSIEGSLNEQW